MRTFVIIIILLFPLTTFAQDHTPNDGGFTFTYENDVFRNTDRSYTNGVRFSWFSQEDNLPDYIKPLTDKLLYPLADQVPIFAKDGRKRISYAIGQSMFTPDDITERALIPTERPYAGWLYGSLALTSDHNNHFDYLELTLGVVGSASLAEQTQTIVHRHITNSPIPEGWDNQLETEPGIIITYEHKWRNVFQTGLMGLEVDITPHAGGSFGNIHTHASLGSTLRIGDDLPNDYGPPRVRPSIAGSDFFIRSKDFGWYMFVGVEGRAVARNIFLDGNSFTESHHVDRKLFIGDLQAGIAFTYDNIRLAYTNVHRTREYYGQDKEDKFGALTLSVLF